MPFVTFGGLAGWLHPAAPGVPASRRAVVLCGAFGDEAYSTHQGWRVLANMLAARGVAALRFDWPGTGDSLGVLPAQDVTGACIASIHRSVAFLRAATGAEDVALVGLRLGALLAAHAAAQSGTIAALALLAPPQAGRVLVREMRLMHSITTLVPAKPGAGLDVAGLHLTTAAMAEIEALRMPADLATTRVLVAHTGAHADLSGAMVIPFEGYDAFMRDNLSSVVPEGLFAQVAGWLDQPGPVAVATPPTLAPAALRVPGAVETPLWFGPGDGLFGILCTPDQPVADSPATILLSSGATHHAGNGRINVLMARHLATQGVTTLRMASPGAGENRASGPIAPYAPGLGSGVSAAIDALAATGHERFAAFGLCSGGYVAFHVARTERRLCALLLLNMQIFDWRPGDTLTIPVRAAATYANAIRSGAVWGRLLGRGGARLTLRRGLRIAAMLLWRRALAAHDGLRRQQPGARALPRTVLGWLRQMECRVMLAWGDADPGLDAARGAFGPRLARLRRVPGVETAVLPGTQHIVNGPGSQAQIMALAAAYLVQPSLQVQRSNPSPHHARPP